MSNMQSDKDRRREEYESMSPRERELYHREKIRREIEDPDFNSALVERARKRMMRVDSFPPAVREVIYDYNLEVVQEFWNHGVKTAKSIRHLIDTVLGNALPDGKPRFKLNKGPNARPNPARFDPDDDDEEYYVAPRQIPRVQR